jgi:NAD(P)-dependent dehydrogenase (short-subunit alcohol dehydrogenase family)
MRATRTCSDAGLMEARLDGKTILVTGATGGIGRHTASALAAAGAHVLITGRDAGRGAQAVATMPGQVTFLAAEHATVAGNRALATAVLGVADRLDVLVNNVGSTPYAQRTVTTEGHEAILAGNLIGPMALTDALLPLLTRAQPARIVNVVSSSYAMWRGDPFVEPDRYVMIQAHARAKLLHLLATLAWARRLGEVAANVTANATNPGMAWTPGTQALTPAAVPAWRWIWPIVRFFQSRASAQKASRSSVFLAADPRAGATTGAYFNNATRPTHLPDRLQDKVLQDRAWEFGAELAGFAGSNPR